MIDAFGVQHPDLVAKDLAGAARWTSKAGKNLSLKAKEAPVKAQVSALTSGEKLLHSSKKTRKALGFALREIGYRPDYLGLAAASLPRALARV